MGLLTKKTLVNRVENELRKGFNYGTSSSKARDVINEARNYQNTFKSKSYDIFLSHSSDDAREVAGLKLILEDYGYSVYVDWIEDPQLDRSNVSKKTAETLRYRMKQSKSLIYAFSENASSSTWMPWELGYFDGIRGLVSIMPVVESPYSTFTGNEYLELYPYVDIEKQSNSSQSILWVNESNDTYVRFDLWLEGKKPYKRAS